MMRWLIVIIVAAALCGCTTTKYVPVESVTQRTDTVRELMLRVDSVVVRDSVVVAQRGDTVYVNRWRDRYRVKMQTDTVYRSVTDSVSVEVPYPVEKKLTRWQQTKMDLGGIAIGVIAVGVIICSVRLWRKLRT